MARHWQHQVRVNRFVYSTVLDERCLAAGVALRFHEMQAAVLPTLAVALAAVMLSDPSSLRTVSTRAPMALSGSDFLLS